MHHIRISRAELPCESAQTFRMPAPSHWPHYPLSRSSLESVQVPTPAPPTYRNQPAILRLQLRISNVAPSLTSLLLLLLHHHHLPQILRSTATRTSYYYSCKDQRYSITLKASPSQIQTIRFTHKSFIS
jgi:hypothetical protein